MNVLTMQDVRKSFGSLEVLKGISQAEEELQDWGVRVELRLLRGYDAASHGRLNAGWRVFNESAELTDRYSRDVIRARARDLARQE